MLLPVTLFVLVALRDICRIEVNQASDILLERDGGGKRKKMNGNRGMGEKRSYLKAKNVKMLYKHFIYRIHRRILYLWEMRENDGRGKNAIKEEDIK